MKRPRLIVVGPLPPPVHGVAVSTSLALADRHLNERFDVRHLDTSDPRPLTNMGRWDVTNIRLGVLHVWRLWRMLRGKPGVMYFALSETPAAFLRDSLFVALARIRGWRVAAHVRNANFRTMYEALPAPGRWWARRTLERLSAVAVLGASTIPLFDGLIPRERFTVVANGTPDLAPTGTQTRGETVLFLSNLRADKGVVEATAAAETVLESRASARFVFAGNWHEEDLKRALPARLRRFGDRARFIPPVAGEEKRALILSSAIVLCPTVITEGQPRVILEAMSAGVPVIATDRGTVAETIVHGETGYVLPDPDPGEIARYVLALLADDARRSAMGDAARRRYLERYTQEQADRNLAEWLMRTSADADGGRNAVLAGEQTMAR